MSSSPASPVHFDSAQCTAFGYAQETVDKDDSEGCHHHLPASLPEILRYAQNDIKESENLSARGGPGADEE